MEKSKLSTIKKVLKRIYKIISSFIVTLLVIIGLFLVFYVVSGKVAQKKGHKPLISMFTIISPSMTPNISVYDVVIVSRVDEIQDIKKGDVITFYSNNDFFNGTPITHRVKEVLNIPGTGLVFETKGDANQKPDVDKVSPNNVIGKVIFRIPQLGRLQFFVASKGGWLIAIMIPCLAIISYDVYKILKLLILKSKLMSLRNKNGNI